MSTKQELPLPDDDRLFAAGHESETQFRMPGQLHLTGLRRFLAPVLARVLIRRRFVQVTAKRQ